MMLFGVRFGKQYSFPTPVFIFQMAVNKTSMVFLVTRADVVVKRLVGGC